MGADERRLIGPEQTHGSWLGAGPAGHTRSLTAEEAGLVEALALTLHFFSKVDRLLAAATLVAPSEGHVDGTWKLLAENF